LKTFWLRSNTVSEAAVVIPLSFYPLNQSGTAICQGAVLFGLDPSIISERNSRKTYGISCSRPFKQGDPEEKKWFHAEKGCFYVDDSFCIFVRNGDQVRSFQFQFFVGNGLYLHCQYTTMLLLSPGNGILGETE
jgi:hypothetical protein